MSEVVASIKTLNGYSLEDTEAREGVAKATRRIDTVSFVVGENLINNETSVVLGVNWAGDAANGYTHEAGSTEPLTIQIATEKPDIAGSTVLQIGSVSTANMRGSITPTMDYQYIAVSFGLSVASETVWNEIAKSLTVQKGNYVTEYTSYYKSEAGTVTWEAVN